MKSKREWLFGDILTYGRYWPTSHPDDFDPTNEQVMALIEAVQRDAYAQGATDARERAALTSENNWMLCDNAPWFGDIPRLIREEPLPEFPQ